MRGDITVGKVKRYRQFIGYSQAQLAKAIDMNLATYRSKEQGKYSFKDSEKLQIKRVIAKEVPNVTIDDIFFD